MSRGAHGEHRRMIVHAGWPKTATTSFQHQIRDYPNLGARPYSRPNGPIDRTVCDRLVRSPEWDPAAFADWLERCWEAPHLPLWYSDESLIGKPLTLWRGRFVSHEERARRVTGTWPATILVTIREPVGLLRSTYRHMVTRDEYPEDYGTFLAAIRRDRADGEGPLAVPRVVETFAREVGMENVRVFRMEDHLDDPVWFWRTIAEVTATPLMEMLAQAAVPHENSGGPGLIGLRVRTNRILNRIAPTNGRRRAALTRVQHRLRARSRIESLIVSLTGPQNRTWPDRWGELEEVVASGIRDDFNALLRVETPPGRSGIAATVPYPVEGAGR